MKITHRRGRTMTEDEPWDSWARAAVRIKADEVDVVPLPPPMLARARRGRTGKILSFDIPNPTEQRMHELLQDTTRFLVEHEQTLAGLEGVEIDVFLGWTPAPDQESAIVDADLIAVLGRLGGSIYFDTYSGESS